jgi:hypothetical protein
MNYISIKQYFYKFHSTLMLILLVPIITFIVIYFSLPEISANDSPTFLIALSSLNALDWIFMFIFFSKKIKTIRNGQGLGLKLEKYFYLTIVRFSMISFGSLALAAGLFATKHDIFTGLFIGNLVLLAGLWPTSPRTCEDLRLRGAEREMVYFKKDRL